MSAEWRQGLSCGYCCNNSCCICCLASVFPCGVYASNVYKMREKGLKLSFCQDPFWNSLLYFTGVAAPCMECSTRTDIREGLRIRGSCFCDCMAVLCCQACALTQEAHELDAYVPPSAIATESAFLLPPNWMGAK